jgi:hypothetical protein
MCYHNSGKENDKTSIHNKHIHKNKRQNRATSVIYLIITIN